MYRQSQQAVDIGWPQPMEPRAIDRLSELSAPTLVVVGDVDMDLIYAIADLLATRVPGARSVTIPGGGHMVSMEQPAAFNAIALTFFAQSTAEKRRN
jgi:pimeloyl-ACP methyl ester carboxylesterase